MRREILSDSDRTELAAFVDETAAIVRASPYMGPALRKVLVSALRQACGALGEKLPELHSREHAVALASHKRAVTAKASLAALRAFMVDVESGDYPYDHVFDENEGERCVFARTTEVFAKYASRDMSYNDFRRYLIEHEVVFEKRGERTINGRRAGHLAIFRVDVIRALSEPASPVITASPPPEVIDPQDAEEVLALATVLKTYFPSPFKGQHFMARVKKRDCLLVSPDDLHEFCQRHHATMDIAAHRLGPRGLKAAARRHGLLQDDNYWLKRDGKMHGHLLAFDVKRVEEFYGRHAPASG